MTTAEALKDVDTKCMVPITTAQHLADEVRRLRDENTGLRNCRCVHWGAVGNIFGKCPAKEHETLTPATVREKWQSAQNPPVDRLDIERYFVVVTRGGMRFVAWRDGEQWIIHKPSESGTMTLDNVRLWLELPRLDDQARGATAAEAPTESPEVPCSEFRLPVVAGRRSLRSNADFERACLVHIERLQLGIGDYDSAMMATFAEAVRMVREYADAMRVRNQNTGLSGGTPSAAAIRCAS